jgi:hypothetical protein
MKKMPMGAVAALLIATALPVAGAGTARAADGEEIRRGSCSGTSDWKIKAKPDDGRIEVESEIDSFRNGQRWRWALRHNGKVVAQGRSRTLGPSGSFEVERRTRNSVGTDAFQFRAVRAGGREVCVARIRL